MSSVSIETTPGSRKRKHDSKFNPGNDNKLVDLLAKNNYFLCTCYVSNNITWGIYFQLITHTMLYNYLKYEPIFYQFSVSTMESKWN